MSADTVQPLRISKNSPAKGHASPASRALAEISPMERRRNSPSWNQATKKMIVSRESSPLDSSIVSSPKALWQSKLSSSTLSENIYERPDSPSMVRHRKSLENLKKASRVKNSSMFAREQAGEYDPISPVVVERPLAAGRPLAGQPQVNEIPRSSDVAKPTVPARGHRRGESQTQIPIMPPTHKDQAAARSPSPAASRHQPSPTKSSLANRQTFPRRFDPGTSQLSDDDDSDKVEPSRPLRRQAKSVTFDVAPPQINEYEMATPDPSSIASGSREGSYDIYDDDDDEDDEDMYDMDRAMEHDDDSFDASLEDTDKTPVVLPEDWRGMTPETANANLAANFDDPFNNTMERKMTPSEQWNQYSTISIESESDLRPLPPVPQITDNSSRRNSGNILERVHNAHRSLPAPPAAASFSKSDILGMKEHAMTLEDRLKLMGIRDGSVEKSSPDQAAREKARLQRHGLGFDVYEDEQDRVQPIEQKLPDFNFPRISRESILRKVKSRNFDSEEVKRELSPPREYDIANLDPDVPIQSREVSADFNDVAIKREDTDDLLDLYSIPAMYADNATPDIDGDHSREGSVIHHATQDDDASVYSVQEDEAQGSSNDSDDGPPTPRQADIFITTTTTEVTQQFDVALPDISALMEDSELHASLQSYLSSGDDEVQKTRLTTMEAPVNGLASVRDFLARSQTPEQHDDIQEPESPVSSVDHAELVDTESDGRVSPVIPEPLATIKAPGGKLKTRPSLTPADAQTMAATRRQVSGNLAPPVPEKSPKRFSFAQDTSVLDNSENGTIERAVREHKKRRESFKPQLDLPGESIDLSLDMDREFDRVIESSKKGYLMRQNTKVVVAKRNFSNDRASSELERPTSADEILASAGGPAFKPSHERAKSWTTEPWNGKQRRKSLRSVDRASTSGPAPPLPGQESALDTVMEDSIMQNEIEDGTERGRLFVKVVGVKDLDLPLPQNERTWFQLTLDNGLHCVTTSRLELGRAAPIGQEFELVVLNDLEFQLTLQTQITPPAQHITPQATPQKAKAAPKKSTFSRLFASPQKRREQDRLAQQQKDDEDRKARERKAQEAARRVNAPATAWDLLHDLVGPDGSFGRAYISLKNHQDACFGRPITVDMPVFNEWAVEDSNIANSVKSKRGNGVLRRPPYEVGKLSLQLLYIPRPKGVKEEDMPKSMNGCIREMTAAERTISSEWEGFLSQQGGDCPFWRRRYFKLSGLNLTAFHETTRQPRAKISLSRATKLIDDKSSLMQPGGKPGKGRRKSAFADEDQAYMFVEEGFRIRFANGEAIDFYADNAADKQGWMEALCGVVGKDAITNGKTWCEQVLRRERYLRERAEQQPSKARPRSQGQAELPPSNKVMMAMKSQPCSPIKRDALGILGTDDLPRSRVQFQDEQQLQTQKQTQTPTQGPPAGRLGSRRHQIRSMIF